MAIQKPSGPYSSILNYSYTLNATAQGQRISVISLVLASIIYVHVYAVENECINIMWTFLL